MLNTHIGEDSSTNQKGVSLDSYFNEKKEPFVLFFGLVGDVERN